jgi:hypothetical protein
MYAAGAPGGGTIVVLVDGDAPGNEAADPPVVGPPDPPLARRAVLPQAVAIATETAPRTKLLRVGMAQRLPSTGIGRVP